MEATQDYFYNPPYKYIYAKGYESLNHNARWRPLAKEILKYKQNGRILDIGCAYGFLLRQLPDAFEKHGIDMSQITVERARKENPSASITQGDFNMMKWEETFHEGSFDVITAFETLEHLLEHLGDLKLVIEKINYLLKDNGYFFASFPIVESWLERKWFTMFDKTHINPSGKVLDEVKKRFEIVNQKYTFDCVKFIMLPTLRIFPVHQSYFITARKK